MNPVERLRVRGRGRRERKREREKERLKSQSERAEGTSARGKKDWGRMSILIKVKLSQSLEKELSSLSRGKCRVP